MTPSLRLGSALLLVGVLAGCQHQHAVHDVANLTAARADDLKAQMAAFVDRANALRNGAAQQSATLQAQTSAIAIDTAATLQTWKATGDADSKTARDIFDAVTAFGRTDVLPIAPPLPSAAPTVAQITFDPGQYEALVQQLSGLGEARSITDEAFFLAGFGSAVDAAYRADMTKASTAATTAAATGNDAAIEVVKPTTP